MEIVLRKLSRYFGAWKIGVMNPDRGLWALRPAPEAIGYLKAMNAKGYHIFMKPEDEGCFLLLDDIPGNGLKVQQDHGRYRPGRLVVETSPGNFQVWLKSSRTLSNPEKRYWIRQFNSDPACDPNLRWGRCPGFFNRKEKYRNKKGRYPLSRLIWVDWRYLAELPKVKLPEEPDPPQKLRIDPQRIKLSKRSGKQGAIQRQDYDRGDESATDFAYVLALLRRGVEPDDVVSRLLTERTDWTHHQGERRKGAYLERTIRKAAEIINL